MQLYSAPFVILNFSSRRSIVVDELSVLASFISGAVKDGFLSSLRIRLKRGGFIAYTTPLSFLTDFGELL